MAHDLLCPLYHVSGTWFEYENNPPALPCGTVLILVIARDHISCSMAGFVSNGVPQPFFISENLDT